MREFETRNSNHEIRNNLEAQNQKWNEIGDGDD